MTEAPAAEAEQREPERPAQPPAVRQIDPELAKYRQLGHWLALAEQRDPDDAARGAAAALRHYYAAELGLRETAALELSFVKGGLVVSARLLRALAARAGYRVARVEDTDESCTAALVEAATGEELGRATFTMADAKRAGLIRDRSAWQTHPKRMLWARASAFVIYDYAPDVALGLRTEDEYEEISGEPAPAPEPEPEQEADEAEWQPVEGGDQEAA